MQRLRQSCQRAVLPTLQRTLACAHHENLAVDDAPQVGEVISRFEQKGFKLIGLKMHTATRGVAEEHYRDLSSKPFFKDLVDYIISGPVICMVRAISALWQDYRSLRLSNPADLAA